jgi:hypothetical protein
MAEAGVAREPRRYGRLPPEEKTIRQIDRRIPGVKVCLDIDDDVQIAEIGPRCAAELGVDPPAAFRASGFEGMR